MILEAGQIRGRDGLAALFSYMFRVVDRVIPGHGTVTNRAGLQTYRDNVVKLRTEVSNLIRQGKSQEEVRAVLAAQ